MAPVLAPPASDPSIVPSYVIVRLPHSQPKHYRQSHSNLHNLRPFLSAGPLPRAPGSASSFPQPARPTPAHRGRVLVAQRAVVGSTLITPPTRSIIHQH